MESRRIQVEKGLWKYLEASWGDRMNTNLNTFNGNFESCLDLIKNIKIKIFIKNLK